MRLSPCRAISGSTTPDASMRRRTISIDCWMAEVARLREVIAGGGLGAAEEAEVLAGLGAIEAKLRALGAVPGEPGEPGGPA